MPATFWLLDAPDSLSAQSHHNPDGTGLGYYDERHHPVIHKAPIAAFDDRDFAREAREAESSTFIAHIRHASTGAKTFANTHPFEQQGRLFAHNGVVGDLPRLERELGDAMALVQGETDSERLFALITREIDARDGDVWGGIVAAVRWVGRAPALYAINLVLLAGDELYALRYPETNSLYVLARGPGGDQRQRAAATIAAASARASAPSTRRSSRVVVVASEQPRRRSGLAGARLRRAAARLTDPRGQLGDRPPRAAPAPAHARRISRRRRRRRRAPKG